MKERQNGLKEPVVRIELTANALQKHCSTTELHRLAHLITPYGAIDVYAHTISQPVKGGCEREGVLFQVDDT